MATHGGKREGAGRKPGAAHKSKRSQTARVIAKRKIIAAMAGERDPLEFILNTMADPDVEHAVRLQAAGMAMPYIYPKLSAMVVQHNDARADDKRGQIVDELMKRLDRLAPPAPVIDAKPVRDAE